MAKQGRLVLCRKVGEVTFLRLGDVEMTVTVEEIDRNKVRLSFVAPPEVVILRDDARESVRNKKRGASDAEGREAKSCGSGAEHQRISIQCEERAAPSEHRPF